MNKKLQITVNTILSFAIALALIVSPVIMDDVYAEDETNYELRPELEKRLPLYGGYYRTWHDESSIGIEGETNGGLVAMDEIPEAVDLVFVFDDWQHEKSPYYDKLKNEYVPNMQAKGQLIIRTIGTEFLYGTTGIAKDKLDYYTNDTKGYKRLAEDIVQKYVLDFNLDGLDVDVEAHNYSLKIITEEQRERIHGVLAELGKLIGPNGKYSDKLFIYDTTLGADTDAFLLNYENYDLILLQRYGVSGERGTPNFDGTYSDNLEETFRKFSQYVSSKKIMIGFSNYEENSTKDNRWYDIPMMDGTVQKVDENNKVNYQPGGIEESRAGTYAKWQPSFGLKGGTFVYAIERDDILHPSKDKENGPQGSVIKTESDVKLPTTFEQSKKLIELQDSTEAYQRISKNDIPDEALLNLIIKKISPFKGDVKRFQEDLVIDDPKIKDLSGIEILEYANIIIKNLNQVEVIDLSGRGLEEVNIELDANSSKLKKLDVSHNALDLSENTQAKKVLDSLSEIILKNNGNDDSEDAINFSNQKIKGYYPKTLRNSKIHFEVKENEKFNIRPEFERTVTYEGTDITTKETFEKFKSQTIFGRKFVSEKVDYDEIKMDFDKFVVSGMTSNREVIASESIDLSVAETYYLDIVGPKTAYKLQVIVGEEKPLLENLALNASFPLDPWATQLSSIVNGSLDTAVTISFSAGTKFVLDLGKDAEVSSIRLYNASANTKGLKRPENDLEGMRFEALINEDKLNKMSTYEVETYLKDDENWQEISKSETAVAIWADRFEPVKSRYWRWHIDSVRGNQVMNSYPMATEIEFIGQRVASLPKIIGPVAATVNNPDNEKYWQVNFTAGENGTMDNESTFYVLNTESVSLNDLEIPEVSALEGFAFTKWDKDLEQIITGDLDVQAQYREYDNHKFDATVSSLIKKYGEEITETDIIEAIQIDGYDDKFTVSYQLDDSVGKGLQSGDHEAKVIITYADKTQTTVTLPIRILDKVDVSVLASAIQKGQQALQDAVYTLDSANALETILVKAGNLLAQKEITDTLVAVTVQEIEDAISNLNLKQKPTIQGINKSIIVKDQNNTLEINFAHAVSSLELIQFNNQTLELGKDYNVVGTSTITFTDAFVANVIKNSHDKNNILNLKFVESATNLEGELRYHIELIDTLKAASIYVANESLDFGQVKLTQVGESHQIDAATQEIVDGKNKNIYAVGNIEYGEKETHELETIIVKTDELPVGKKLLIKGTPQISRTKKIYLVDPNNGELINPQIEKEIILEGNASILKVGTKQAEKTNVSEKKPLPISNDTTETHVTIGREHAYENNQEIHNDVVASNTVSEKTVEDKTVKTKDKKDAQNTDKNNKNSVKKEKPSQKDVKNDVEKNTGNETNRRQTMTKVLLIGAIVVVGGLTLLTLIKKK